MAERVTLGDRLRAKLRKLGLGERKAKEIAKALLPTVRAAADSVVKDRAVKAAAKAEKDGYAKFLDKYKDNPQTALGPGECPISLGRGYTFPVHLPIAPMQGVKGIELLRVMDGLCSRGTYVVMAVKGDVGIVAVRKLSSDRFNVKFYPTMAYWDATEEGLTEIGADDFLAREHYERMHFSQTSLDELLNRLVEVGKPKKRMKGLMDRFLTVPTKYALIALNYLRPNVAA